MRKIYDVTPKYSHQIIPSESMGFSEISIKCIQDLRLNIYKFPDNRYCYHSPDSNYRSKTYDINDFNELLESLYYIFC